MPHDRSVQLHMCRSASKQDIGERVCIFVVLVPHWPLERTEAAVSGPETGMFQVPWHTKRSAIVCCFVADPSMVVEHAAAWENKLRLSTHP